MGSIFREPITVTVKNLLIFGHQAKMSTLSDFISSRVHNSNDYIKSTALSIHV